VKILSFLFPGFTVLDLTGPTTAWGLMPGNEFQFVSSTKGPVKSDMGLQLVATHDFSDCWAEPDVVFVPGRRFTDGHRPQSGEWRRSYRRDRFWARDDWYLGWTSAGSTDRVAAGVRATAPIWRRAPRTRRCRDALLDQEMPFALVDSAARRRGFVVEKAAGFS
jgi:hypothetical protein